MSVKVDIGGLVGVVTEEKWSAPDKPLLEILRMFTSDEILDYTPWPDYTLAEMAVKALGGKIIATTNPPEYVEGRVY